MELFKNKNRRFTFAGLILISFSIMAAFSIFLHDHEFDPFTMDEDCAPCHWTQISVNLDLDIPSINFIPVTFSNKVEAGVFHYKNFKHIYFGLSPPVLS